jgi:hypothetical protein
MVNIALKYTVVRGLKPYCMGRKTVFFFSGHLTLWCTHTAVGRSVRRSEPSMFAFISSFLSVDGMTCHISF